MKTNIISRRPAEPTPVNFRSFLQEELARRCSKNAQYSLRSFALQLEIDHSSLSQIMRGKRPLTPRMIERFGAKLELNKTAIEEFIACEKACEMTKTASLKAVRQLARDTATLISDVHHYTLLELVRLKGFRADSNWIARVLDLSVDEVNIMISRLIRLGLLEMTSDDHWTDISGDTISTAEDFNNAVIQKLSERLLSSAQALPSSANGTNTYGHHNSTIVAVDNSTMRSVMSLISRFEMDLAKLLSSVENPDEIYQIDLNLFPVTNPQETKEQHNGSASYAMADTCQKS